MSDAPYATAIWAEIVEMREEEINRDFSETNTGHMPTLVAAGQELSREQLAEWDASARAWLRAADEAKSEQVTRLRLKNALTQMEALIKGTLQAVQSGELLLAIYAWHLFPNLSVVSSPRKEVLQQDDSFPDSTTFTIGLETSPNASLDSNERSRLSREELLQTTLGCFLRGWGLAGSHTPSAVGLLSDLEGLLIKAASASCPQTEALIDGISDSWLGLVFEAAKSFLTSAGDKRAVARKLIALGRRQGPKAEARNSWRVWEAFG
ncbi:hypothetical protein VTN77DRAFT_8350 [Rasamsonia byssochlamydoides]|uniref:uncharacterized protein n=1 Tax=Rasamsonia byssochlamydoides TaxID=89139 RepID=UPI0037434526